MTTTPKTPFSLTSTVTSSRPFLLVLSPVLAAFLARQDGVEYTPHLLLSVSALAALTIVVPALKRT